MTLTDFAAECVKVSSNAVYLDMGKYGYGYIGNRILSPWALYARNKQTNWIGIYEHLFNCISTLGHDNKGKLVIRSL